MNNSMKFLCSQIFRLISPGSSWFNKHCPICQSGYGAVASLLQCTHPAVRSPVPAPAVRDMAVVRSPQAVPAVQCLLEQIHCLWLFHIRKKKRKGLIAWVWKMCMANSSAPLRSVFGFGSASSTAAIKIFPHNSMARNKFQRFNEDKWPDPSEPLESANQDWGNYHAVIFLVVTYA